jgi:AcrR family transcriptional regulator
MTPVPAGPGSAEPSSGRPGSAGPAQRRRRADAQRNIGSLLAAAKAVFATSGVDAPAKEIADAAGVGVGTLYRHFPQRSDLVKAVVEHGVDACADAVPVLAATYEPAEALARWLHQYTEFVGTKRGLASALHSGDPAYADISAEDLLYAVANLCLPVPGGGVSYSQRMVALLMDGLRCRAVPMGH